MAPCPRGAHPARADLDGDAGAAQCRDVARPVAQLARTFPGPGAPIARRSRPPGRPRHLTDARGRHGPPARPVSRPGVGPASRRDVRARGPRWRAGRDPGAPHARGRRDDPSRRPHGGTGLPGRTAPSGSSAWVRRRRPPEAARQIASVGSPGTWPRTRAARLLAIDPARSRPIGAAGPAGTTGSRLAADGGSSGRSTCDASSCMIFRARHERPRRGGSRCDPSCAG